MKKTGSIHLASLAVWLCYLIVFLPVVSALQISQIEGKRTSPTEAKITFKTDISAEGSVQYGTSIVFDKNASGPRTREHEIAINGLEEKTVYFYHVRAQTVSQNMIDNNGGNYYELRPLAPKDTTPPVISNVSFPELTDTKTTVSWLTDELATSQIFVTDQGTARTQQDVTLQKQHRLSMDTTKGRQFKIIAMSCNADSLCTNSSETTLIAGPDQSPPLLEVTIPSFSSENKLLLQGKSEPHAKIIVSVNGQSLRESFVDQKGVFKITNIPLNKLENQIQVAARDIAGNSEIKIGKVRIDAAPPRLQIREFPSVQKENQFKISGRTDEPINVSVFVHLQEDPIAPNRVSEVKASDIQQGRISLAWKQVNDSDVLEYAVYRDNVLIGLSKSTSFIDEGAPNATLVRYRVSAVDKSCNEGPKSNTYDVKTAQGPFPTPQKVNEFSCKRATATFAADGDFVQQIVLQQGINHILLVAKDQAGNTVTYENETVFDSQPPRFEHLNIGDISPVYVREITIKGKANEPVTVLVFVNDDKKPAETSLSAPDGSFKIDVALPVGVVVTEDSKTKIAGGSGFANKVRVEIIDRAANKAVSREEDIIFTQCGFGSSFAVYKTSPRPDTINSRLIVEGFGQFGFNVNLTYLDIGNFSFRGKPTVLIRPLSREEESKWDKNVAIVNRWDLKGTHAQGFVQLNVQRPKFPDGATLFEKSDNVSQRRVNKCPLIPPGLGCLRVPLMLEIQGVKTLERTPEGIEVSNELGPQTTEVLQRTCIDVQVAIDKPIDPEIIHDGFLKQSIKTMDNIVENIDKILEPLETIFKVTMYSCLAGFAVMFILDIWETYTCEVSPVLDMFAKDDSTWDPKVARAGLCNHPQYGYAAGTKSFSACKDCQGAAQKVKDINHYINWVCDRVFCPSAPSIQKYVREISAEKPSPIPYGKKSAGTAPAPSAGHASPNPLTIGSSCAAQCPTCNTPFVEAKGYDSIKSIFDDYNKHKADKVDENAVFNPDNPNCNNLHPSAQACCGYEYMEQFDSACALGFDELKESKCMQAEIEGRDDPECKGFGRVFNALAGFCEAKGGAPEQIVYTDLEIVVMPPDASSKQFFLTVNNEKGSTVTERVSKRTVRGAYQTTTLKTGATVGPDLLEITKKDTLKKTGDYSKFFQQQQVDCSNFGAELTKGESAFGIDLKVREGVSYPSSGVAGAAKDACEKVKKSFPEGRDYIVDPTSSFLRSMQCGCIAGVNAYLNKYRNILGAVSNCFKAVLVTGDGSEGQCQEILSVYICDMLYEAISCAVNYFDLSSAGEEKGPFGRLGNVLKAVTRAGSKTQQRINNRYGSSSIFKAMFGERKIVHAICLFAFTGVWSFDVSSLLESGIPQVPIDSTVLIFPAERRFVSYDLTSKPPGIATFNYHVAYSVAAGADLNQRMYLVCSADLSCNPADGFPGGKCDCLTSGEKRVSVGLKQGQIKSGQLYTENLFLNIPGPTSNQGQVRFDKVIYEYDFRDKDDRIQKKVVEKKLGQVGGEPPVECQFDFLTGIFRCTLDIGSERFARFSGDPTPLFPDDARTFRQFKLGSVVRFSVPVLARVDEACTPPCKDTKYLIYTIKSGGSIVKKGQEIVGTNDPHIISPKKAGAEREEGRVAGIREKEMIAFTGEKTIDLDLFSITTDIFATPQPPSLQIISPRISSAGFSVAGLQTKPFVVVVYSDNTADIFSGMDSSTYKGKVATSAKVVIVSDKLNFEGLQLRLPDETKRKSLTTDPIVIEIKPPSAGCDVFNPKKDPKARPLKLTATFELRDTEEIGAGFFRPGTTIAIDPEGKQQKRTVTFDAVCSDVFAETEDAKFEAKYKECNKEEILTGNCQCYDTKEETQKAITLGKEPNCGPKTDAGDICTQNGKCVKSNKCEKDKIIEAVDAKCRCYRQNSELVNATLKPEPENCGRGVEISGKKAGNFCDSKDGACKAGIHKIEAFEAPIVPPVGTATAGIPVKEMVITGNKIEVKNGQGVIFKPRIFRDMITQSLPPSWFQISLPTLKIDVGEDLITSELIPSNHDPFKFNISTTLTFNVTDAQGDVFTKDVEVVVK